VLEKTIASLLEHMSKSIARQTNLPSKGAVKDLKDDLEYKKNLVENSETTYARLKVELE
jgi:ribonucleotide reductase alpha subunit